MFQVARITSDFRKPQTSFELVKPHAPPRGRSALAPIKATSGDSDIELELTTVKKKAKHQQIRQASKTKKLSTERSRLCRQRQKMYAENLETTVRALQFELQDLQMLRDLRREQIFATRSSPAGSLTKIINEYCTVFRYGMASETAPNASGSMLKKRALTLTNELTPAAQREFMNSVMDPQVEVFDWCAAAERMEAFALWHSSLVFEVDFIEAVNAEEALAVRTQGRLRVRVSEQTIQYLFPHIANSEQLRNRLIGQEVVYSLRDTFYFSEECRVVKYNVDIDFIGGLHAVIGNYSDVLQLVKPADQPPLDDLAIRPPHSDPVSSDSPRSRLDVQYLLS
uniref:BZIP domain-containing protein n=1 Tax=Globisporangium ultimum (strain ATCC 200006 / CBS 805.95 / DAOM BR144) TaxID=431595 RepID=K3WNV2_GLOUD